MKRRVRRRPARTLRGNPEEYELRVHIDNEFALYKAKQAMRGAITKKVCRGQFDAAKAAKGFRHVVDAAAISYAGPMQARYAFPGKVRDAVARELTSELKSEINRCLRDSKDCGDAPAELSKCPAAKPLAGLGRARRAPAKKRRK